MTTDTWASMVTVGRVTRPHGNRGEVSVAPETDFGDTRFGIGATVMTEGAIAPEARRVVESREYRGRWIVRFEGFDSIDAAETLRGRELRVPASSLRALDAGAFYAHDLVGCDVRDGAGQPIGRVARVDLATGVPMLVLAGTGGEVLVPFVDAICRRVDVGGRVIEIDPPEGLIDLNQGRWTR